MNLAMKGMGSFPNKPSPAAGIFCFNLHHWRRWDGIMVIADRGDGVFTHGTTCAYCLWRFSRDPDEVVTVCPSCATPYHTECFDENGGCATFGCANWVNAQGPGVPGAVVAPPPQQQFQPPPATVTAAAQVPVVPVGRQPSPPAVRWNFCSQCGASLGANYEFCIQCGHPIGMQA